MSKQVKLILFKIDTVLITEVVELDAQLGDPNCKLINPLEWKKNDEGEEYSLKTWIEATNQTELMVRAEDILTITDPLPEVVEKYLELTGE
jgi:hypothetical protein|tara:strand:- start:177 stop:449 length:273 start_codon:yes stop_codon:yes gene_type:complete